MSEFDFIATDDEEKDGFNMYDELTRGELGSYSTWWNDGGDIEDVEEKIEEYKKETKEEQSREKEVKKLAKEEREILFKFWIKDHVKVVKLSKEHPCTDIKINSVGTIIKIVDHVNNKKIDMFDNVTRKEFIKNADFYCGDIDNLMTGPEAPDIIYHVLFKIAKPGNQEGFEEVEYSFSEDGIEKISDSKYNARKEDPRLEGGKKKRTKRRKSIKINPKMKGVFTRKAKKNKMSVQKYARYIIKKYKGKTKNKRELKILRQAVFAKTAKKWKKKTKRRR